MKVQRTFATMKFMKCGKNDQIAGNVCAKQAKPEKAERIRAAGDQAQYNREQPDATGSAGLRYWALHSQEPLILSNNARPAHPPHLTRNPYPGFQVWIRCLRADGGA